MSGYGMMIPGSKARSNLVSERPTEHGGKEVEHNMIKEAAEFADRAHQGVFRKGTEIPYITHPMETAAIVTAFTDEPEMIAAALLHDVIEDAGVTREELEESKMEIEEKDQQLKENKLQLKKMQEELEHWKKMYQQENK